MKQGLAGVNIAYANHYMLIQERFLDADAPATRPGMQNLAVKLLAQGLGAQPGQQRMLANIVAWPPQNCAESTRIAKTQ